MWEQNMCFNSIWNFQKSSKQFIVKYLSVMQTNGLTVQLWSILLSSPAEAQKSSITVPIIYNLHHIIERDHNLDFFSENSIGTFLCFWLIQ